MSATGTSTFSTAGRTVAKIVRTLLPKGKYTATLRASKLEIRAAASSPGKPVRVAGVVLEIQHEGKTVKIYNDIYTSLKPGKDGAIMPDRPGQIVQLAAALDSQLADIETLSTTYTDETEGEVTCGYLDPQTLKAYLENNDGAVVGVEVKVEKQKNKDGSTEDVNRIANFLPPSNI